MKYILSWGGGVNSSAIIAMHLLGKLSYPKKDLHIVFADTGAEMPETYEYVNVVGNMLVKKGYTVKVLRPYSHPEFYNKIVEGKSTLTEFCKKGSWLPSTQSRYCTYTYKVVPLRNYRYSLCSTKKKWKEETVMILGIASDEKKRAKELGSEHTVYPLIENNIDRKGCVELIKKANLPQAHKSGCFYCPFQRKAQWIKLYRDYPELFKQVEELEQNKLKNKPDNKYCLVETTPIRDKIEKWLSKEKDDCKQGELFEEYRHCLCEL